MYSIGVTGWYRWVCFNFPPQERNIFATNREHCWNNFGTWPPQKRSVFGTVSWHFMKTATNRELLPPQIGNFCDFISKNWQISVILHHFAAFSTTSPLPYLLLLLHFRHSLKSLLLLYFWDIPPQKRYFPHIWEQYLWNKKGTFSFFFTQNGISLSFAPLLISLARAM